MTGSDSYGAMLRMWLVDLLFESDESEEEVRSKLAVSVMWMWELGNG